MRFGFVTCVQLGLSVLEEIYEMGGRADLLVTLHDNIGVSKSGRVMLDDFASKKDTPLVKVRSVNDADAIDAISQADLDWLFIIGWSQIAKPAILNSARRGALGMHPTLLPEGRGRASVPWAIIKGLDKTGVSLFILDEGVDTGPVVAQIEIPLTTREDATSLYGKVAAGHRQLIRKAWPLLKSEKYESTPQDERKATVWPGRTPADGEISSSMSVLEVDRLVRGVTRPYPGAFWREGDRVWRVWSGEPGLAPQRVKSVTVRDGDYSFLDAECELGVSAR